MDSETAEAIDTVRAKRHANIIGETLRDDIRMRAEAIVSLGEKIDRA
jgi:hypothetical protein